MKMTKLLLLAFLCLPLCLAAQDPASSAENTENQGSKAQKKVRNKKSDEADPLNASTFSDSVAEAVMRRLADALEAHNRKLMLSAFDSDKMDDYQGFQGQVEAFFDHYASVRVHLRILQSTTEGEKGIMLTDIEMESLPGGEAVPGRKHDQIRFELERGHKGWRIVDIKPRDFFS